MQVLPRGVRHIPSYLDRAAQEALVEDIRNVVQAAPLYVPTMPKTGKPMSVRMTNCGALGWVTDRERGYRYQATHPETGSPWPPIPATAARSLGGGVGLARIRRKPASSISIPTTPRWACTRTATSRSLRRRSSRCRSATIACFGSAGPGAMTGPLSFKLKSGDIVVLGGEGRLCFHGVDRIYPMTSTLLKNGGRINLTLRRVT